MLYIYYIFIFEKGEKMKFKDNIFEILKNSENVIQEQEQEKEQSPEKPKYKKNEHKLKKQISINLDICIIEYFKTLSQKNGVPYQTLINLYLLDCAKRNKQIEIS